jgi:O-antigen/teichoic acid export membrane protein
MTVADEDPQQREAARPDPARLDQYRRWARFLFVLLAIVAGVGFGLLLVTAPLEVDRLLGSWPLVLVLALNIVATLVVLLRLIQGLRDRAPWALQAVAPVCYVLIAFGLVRSVRALVGGGFLVPLEALAALLVLSRPHGPELLPVPSDEDRRRVRLVTAVLVLTYFVPLLIESAGR